MWELGGRALAGASVKEGQRGNRSMEGCKAHGTRSSQAAGAQGIGVGSIIGERALEILSWQYRRRQSSRHLHRGKRTGLELKAMASGSSGGDTSVGLKGEVLREGSERGTEICVELNTTIF